VERQSPILKERLFGLTNSESNRGEDVEEYYFYLDSTPTHSYLKYLYKYPQAAFPYSNLVETSRRRSRSELEHELLDTGVFDQDRSFDVFVEYAKGSPGDILIRITVHNRGPDAAQLRVLPTLWFRNQWSWGGTPERPTLEQVAGGNEIRIVKSIDPYLGERYLYCEGQVLLLFTENETNAQRIFGVANRCPYVKDGINNYVVNGQEGAVNPDKKGTKVAAHYRLTVEPGQSQVIRLRLSDIAPTAYGPSNGQAVNLFGDPFEKTFALRRTEADEFYATVIPPTLNADAANVMRQALAGMLWSKQFYLRLKVRSMVGLLPLCAATTYDGHDAGKVPGDR
jgi:hypothetical protein